jgi:hypothetical protein
MTRAHQGAALCAEQRGWCQTCEEVLGSIVLTVMSLCDMMGRPSPQEHKSTLAQCRVLTVIQHCVCRQCLRGLGPCCLYLLTVPQGLHEVCEGHLLMWLLFQNHPCCYYVRSGSCERLCSILSSQPETTKAPTQK